MAIGKNNSEVLLKTMVGCDKLTLNIIQVTAPAPR